MRQRRRLVDSVARAALDGVVQVLGPGFGPQPLEQRLGGALRSATAASAAVSSSRPALIAIVFPAKQRPGSVGRPTNRAAGYGPSIVPRAWVVPLTPPDSRPRGLSSLAGGASPSDV
jgi:hypothetical protein